MDHSYKQVFLFGVGKELDVPFSAVMTDHSKACAAICLPGSVLYIYETPVHLICLSRTGIITPSAVSLGGGRVLSYDPGTDALTREELERRDIMYIGDQIRFMVPADE